MIIYRIESLIGNAVSSKECVYEAYSNILNAHATTPSFLEHAFKSVHLYFTPMSNIIFQIKHVSTSLGAQSVLQRVPDRTAHWLPFFCLSRELTRFIYRNVWKFTHKETENRLSERFGTYLADFQTSLFPSIHDLPVL